MRIRFWQFEYDFDRDDAKIVVPIILLLVAISVTDLSPLWLLTTIVAYYLLYFFAMDLAGIVKDCWSRRKMRCPNCKNRKIFLQGYQGYKSDEQYAYYFCDHCKTTSILTDGGLLKVSS